MSLIGALNIAVSSVSSLNAAIRTVSDNVANADNEDYNAREVNFGNLQTGGVFVLDIQRRVNEGLFNDLQGAVADTASSAVRKDYYERIEDLLGVTGSQTPLIDKTEALNSAWKAFEAAPESDAAEKSVITAAENLTRELERISDGLDTIEQSVAADIESSVNLLNDTLVEFNELNDEIVKNKAKHLPVSHLENLRDEQLLILSELMEIKTISNSDGSIAVSATSGLDLVLLNPSTFTWNSGTGALTKSGSTSTNLVTDNKIPDGKLKALIDLARNDDTAVSSTDGIFNPIDKLRNQLDEFAFALTDDSVTRHTGTVNLAGETDIIANTAVTTGQTLTINAGGQAAATTITITGTVTIDNLLTSINAITNVEARVDAHGRLQILTSAEGMVIGGTAVTGLGLTAATYAADTDPTLNYAYGEESAQGTANISGNTNLAGLAGITDGNTFSVQVAGGATTTITLGPTAPGVNSTTDLLAALNNIEGVRAKLTDDGFLRISSVEGNLVINETSGTPLSGANGLGFSLNGSTVAIAGTAGTGEQATGFFEVVSGSNLTNASRTNIRVNDLFSSGAKNLKDGSGSSVVAALSANTRNAAGSGLTLTNESYTGMMTGLITDINDRSSRYESLFDLDFGISTNLSTKLRNEVGVDLDEEMAQLTVLQNSYAATARVISTVNQMFQSLEQAVR